MGICDCVCAQCTVHITSTSQKLTMYVRSMNLYTWSRVRRVLTAPRALVIGVLSGDNVVSLYLCAHIRHNAPHSHTLLGATGHALATPSNIHHIP